MRELGLEYAPVVDNEQGDRFLGVLSSSAVHRRLIAEVLARQQEADKKYGLGAA